MLLYLSVDLVWLLRKSKEGDGFQGWHKDFFLGGRIAKTIVVTLGSKERQKEDTPVSIGNTLEDKWEEVEEYALSVLNNSEDELHEPVANHTKTFFVAAEDDLKPPATPQEKMFETKMKTNCQLFPPKNHQSQLTMIRNLQLLF